MSNILQWICSRRGVRLLFSLQNYSRRETILIKANGREDWCEVANVYYAESAFEFGELLSMLMYLETLRYFTSVNSFDLQHLDCHWNGLRLWRTFMTDFAFSDILNNSNMSNNGTRLSDVTFAEIRNPSRVKLWSEIMKQIISFGRVRILGMSHLFKCLNN